MKVAVDFGAPNKMKELILYVCKQSENDANFGATKLNKILFYSDFVSFLKLGKSITGQKYQKLKKGPAPRCLIPIRREMVEQKEAELAEEDRFGFLADRLIALREPDISKFSAEEISLVDKVMGEFSGMNNTEISNFSHHFIGWKAAKLQDEIPYECALVGVVDDLTNEERTYGKALEKLAIKVFSTKKKGN